MKNNMNQREIKFRAWDKEEKCMAGPADNLYVDFNRGKCWIKNFEDNLIQEVDFVLMQFTGLKDKNGKEIYEGDIVLCENTLPEPRFWNDPVIWDDHRWSPFHRSLPTRVEVIGNIYENPELLQ